MIFRRPQGDGQDFVAIKDMGLNAVRVPFGYWIVLGPGPGEPYEGPAMEYLDLAVQWAEECDLEVPRVLKNGDFQWFSGQTAASKSSFAMNSVPKLTRCPID